MIDPKEAAKVYVEDGRLTMTDDKKPLPITREMVEELAALTEEARTHWKVSEVVSEPRERRIQELRGKVWRVEPLIALLDHIDEQEKEIESLKLDIDDLVDRAPSRDDVEYEIEQKAWELYVYHGGGRCSSSDCFTDAECFITYRNRRRRQEKKG